MTPRDFCQPDANNRLKCAVHGAMLLGAVVCCGYNAAAFFYRGERHNGVNAVVYFALVMLEAEHVRHHAESAP